MDKRVANADVAIEKLFDGATILVGGFGTCGNPENLIARRPPQGHEESYVRVEQRGHGGFRPGLAAADTPD